MSKTSPTAEYLEGARAQNRKIKPSETYASAPRERDVSDQVNRFLLCTLVSESSKRIKESAAKAGEPMPLASIVRGVLRAYRIAASDPEGPLSGPMSDMSRVKRLNDEVLRFEIARHTGERVRNTEARLDRAERLGDESRIKAEKGELELALQVRRRLAEVYR